MHEVLDIDESSVEQELRDYIRYLMSQLEELYFETSALRAVLENLHLPGYGMLHLDVDKLIGQLRGSELWEDCHGLFAPILAEIEQELDQREALEAILQMHRNERPN